MMIGSEIASGVRVLAISLLVLAGLAAPAAAGVVVLVNHTPDTLAFTATTADGRPQPYTLAAGDLVPVPASRGFTLDFQAGKQARRYELSPNSIHYFMVQDGKLDLFKLPLPGIDGAGPPGHPEADAKGPLWTVTVKLLVDDDERAVQAVWEKRLRKRLAEASAIFERHCRVRFEVAAVDTWASDNRTRSFEKTIDEFERTVRPAPAALAIGFTGQYKLLETERHLGGVRGPFRTHILIGEWPQYISQSERLEVLVHELGHYLGAVHTLDSKSVMRPILGDRQSHARSFRIGFDAPNTLAMYLVAEGRSAGPASTIAQLSPETRGQLRAVYAVMAKSMPKDQTIPRYMALLGVQ